MKLRHNHFELGTHIRSLEEGGLSVKFKKSQIKAGVSLDARQNRLSKVGSFASGVINLEGLSFKSRLDYENSTHHSFSLLSKLKSKDFGELRTILNLGRFVWDFNECEYRVLQRPKVLNIDYFVKGPSGKAGIN